MRVMPTRKQNQKAKNNGVGQAGAEGLRAKVEDQRVDGNGSRWWRVEDGDGRRLCGIYEYKYVYVNHFYIQFIQHNF